MTLICCAVYGYTHPHKNCKPRLMVLALIENSCTINKISWPTHISYGFKKVSIFAVKHKPLSKSFKFDRKRFCTHFCALHITGSYTVQSWRSTKNMIASHVLIWQGIHSSLRGLILYVEKVFIQSAPTSNNACKL